MVITRFKSHPYTDKKKRCTVTERTEMSHTKPEPNTTKGMQSILERQSLNRKRSKNRTPWLHSVTNHANPPSIRRKSSPKRNFTGDTAHFIEKRVFSKSTGEGKNFH